MKRLLVSAAVALTAGACATAQPERITFDQAMGVVRPSREPKKKKELAMPPGAVPSPELEGALVKFGNTVRGGRGGAPKGAAMPTAQVEAWSAALTGVEAFLDTDPAKMSPFDLVRARIVLETEYETDAALWGDFPKAVADHTQSLLSSLKSRLQTVTALRTPPRPVNWKKFAWPVQPVVITSPFGYRVHPISGDYKEHKGVDLLADAAQPVYAPYAGTVVFSGWHGSYGKHIELQHSIEITTTYSHLMNLMVHEGDVVKKGQLIGLAGDTGNATGVHLHFELYKEGHPIDPELSLPPTVDLFRVAGAW